MNSPDALVFGGGPAGVAAACELAAAGCSVLLVHQDGALGGPVHRHEGDGGASPRVAPSRRWRRLAAEMAGLGGRITVRLRTAFVGLDGEGKFLVRDMARNAVGVLRAPRAVFALGAVEQVPPVPGWQQPGVMTAGGLQLLVKGGVPLPAKRVVLAGSGPLLLALAAQMARAGHPPIAVLEAGRPFRVHPAGLGLLEGPEYLWEALRYQAILRAHGVPYRMGAQVVSVDGAPGALDVAFRAGADSTIRHLEAGLVAFHDGLAPNDHGLPRAGLHASGVRIQYAGDCREVLGGRAAIADGRLAALSLLSEMGRTAPDAAGRAAKWERTLNRHRRIQRAVTRLFATEWPAPATWPDHLVLCRCENRTVGDLRAVLDPRVPSPKEIKLVGRFCMGECQGRLCERSVRRFLGDREGIPYPAKSLVGERWPVRPTPISAFLDDAGAEGAASSVPPT
jgi:NADPH-dependent 2,4-dienoyl-CoA reductase/sulfur reductase-like enzyme